MTFLNWLLIRTGNTCIFTLRYKAVQGSRMQKCESEFEGEEQMSEKARERKCEEAILRESECEEALLVLLFRPCYPKNGNKTRA